MVYRLWLIANRFRSCLRFTISDLRFTNRGFSLIELLVVVVILAVLVAVGAVVYSNQQKSARDARRKEDINTIAAVFEGQKSTNSTYIALDSSMFTLGKLPVDPLGTAVNDYAQPPYGTNKKVCGNLAVDEESRCWYCIKGAGRDVGYCNPNQDHSLDNSSAFASGTSYANTRWVVCANLEAGTPAYYCRTSVQ